jgi:hypothetical protein
MLRLALGGFALGAAAFLAVDFLLARTTPSSEQLARMRLYDLWIRSGILTVHLN